MRLRGVGFIPEALTFGRSAAYKVRNSIDSAMTRMSMSMGLTRKSESKPREPDVTPEQLAGLSPRELVQQAYREADKLCLFMVLDLCPGGALKSLLLKQLVSPNRLIVTWPDRIRWAGQIAEAMAQLEDAGVWHRDLKLDNCLLTSEIPGEADIKVADLGLAVRIRGGWGGDRPSAEASKLIKARFSYASLRDMGDSSFEGTQHSRQPRSSSKGGHGTARGTPSNNGSVRGAPRASKDVSLHGAPLMSKDSSLHGGPRMSKDVSLHGAGKLAGMARLFQPHSTLPDPPEDLPTVQPLRDPSGNAGTVLYQAPEVLRETEGSVQSDVFSWGILMYEMAKVRGRKRKDKGKKLGVYIWRFDTAASLWFGRTHTVDVCLHMVHDDRALYTMTFYNYPYALADHAVRRQVPEPGSSRTARRKHSRGLAARALAQVGAFLSAAPGGVLAGGSQETTHIPGHPPGESDSRPDGSSSSLFCPI